MSYTKMIDGVIVPLSDQEVLDIQQYEAGATDRLSAKVRTQRDLLLAETDWWVLPDRAATQEQLDYRQALRDITSQEGFPTNVTWPVKP